MNEMDPECHREYDCKGDTGKLFTAKCCIWLYTISRIHQTLQINFIVYNLCINKAGRFFQKWEKCQLSYEVGHFTDEITKIKTK